MTRPAFISILLASVLAGCAPAGVPSSASTHWSLKNGFNWTWELPTNEGCIYWSGSEDWVSVRAAVGSPCGDPSGDGSASGKGAHYFSVTDELTFTGYWPWNSEIYDGLIVFDENGKWIKTLPCPYRLNSDQIGAMRPLVDAAKSKAKTEGERRVLSRMAERIAQIDGQALSSSQFGCSDQPLDAEARRSAVKVDPWSPR